MVAMVSYVLSVRSKMKRQLLTSQIDNLNTQVSSLVEGTTDGLKIDREEIDNRAANPLTDREFEILMLAVSGKNNSEIAEELHVSVNTIKFHMKKLYEKLGVNSRKAALQFAMNLDGANEKSDPLS